VSKNQGWELIQQKYKANESTSRHNPKKNKTKTNNQQKPDKDPMQSRHNPKKKQKRTINKSQVKTRPKEHL
jgi:hypothetical protein